MNGVILFDNRGELRKEESGVVLEAMITWCPLDNIKQFFDHSPPAKSIHSGRESLIAN